MKDFAQIKEMVGKRFGTAYYSHVNAEPVYLSKGIRAWYLDDGDIQEVINSVGRFQKGDFGSAEEMGRKEEAGHEYGRYVTTLTSEAGDDTAIWVHRDNDALIVYFRFER